MASRLPDKRTRLIQSAAKLAHRQGYNETTLAHVAEDAAVPLGNVYYYFKTKDEIGAAMLRGMLRGQRVLLDEWERKPDPKHRLLAFVQNSIDSKKSLSASGCAMGTLAAELGKERGPLAQSARELFEVLLQWIESQLAALGRSRDAHHLATELLAAVQGASLLTYIFHDSQYIEREGLRLKTWIRSL